MFATLICAVVLGQTYVVPDGRGGFVAGSGEAVRQYQERQGLASIRDANEKAAAKAWLAQRDAWASDVAAVRLASDPSADRASLVANATASLPGLASEARAARARIAAKRVPVGAKKRDWSEAVRKLAEARGLTPELVERGLAVAEAEPGPKPRTLTKAELLDRANRRPPMP